MSDANVLVHANPEECRLNVKCGIARIIFITEVFIAMRYHTDWIMKQVNEMQAVLQEHADVLKVAPDTIDKQLATQFKDFKKQHPPLFNKASRPMQPADMSIMKSMLSRLQSIQQGDITPYDADVELGEILADRYIRPMVANQTR